MLQYNEKQVTGEMCYSQPCLPSLSLWMSVLTSNNVTGSLCWFFLFHHIFLSFLGPRHADGSVKFWDASASKCFEYLTVGHVSLPSPLYILISIIVQTALDLKVLDYQLNIELSNMWVENFEESRYVNIISKPNNNSQQCSNLFKYLQNSSLKVKNRHENIFQIR